MTAKPKRKGQSPGILRAFLNEFLFIRPLLIETALTPDQCAERLESLAHGLRNGFSTAVETDHETDPVTFVVALRRHVRQREDTSAAAYGQIAEDHITGLTAVRGEIRFARPYYVDWLKVLAFSAVVFAISVLFRRFEILLGVCWVVWGMVIIGVMLGLLFKDRNALARRIESALINDVPFFDALDDFEQEKPKTRREIHHD